MKSTSRMFALLLLSVVSRRGSSQSQIPIRDLAPPAAESADTLGYLNGVRQLSDGRVLVNDAGHLRLLLMNAGLRTLSVIADTSGEARVAYGSRATGIIRYRGDSTLLVDIGGRAFVVIDGSGAAPRVMSAPRPNDVTSLGASGTGTPAIDADGRLTYRTFLMPAFKAPVVGKPYTPPVIADSAPLLRANFDTRVADTIAWLRVPRIKVHTDFLANGGVRLSPIIAPIATVDDWTALPDGSIAILRGADYHIDWIDADGSRRSTAKMPFDWKRLSDSDKARLVDSAQKALDRQAVVTIAAGSAPAAGGGHGGGVNMANHSMTIMPIGGDDGMAPAQTATKADAPPHGVGVVPAQDLPDYLPPISRIGEMRADFDGNVWILPATSLQAGRGLLYDVVNRSGQITQRVRLPEGRALEGFGPGGVIYLSSHGAQGSHLEITRIR